MTNKELEVRIRDLEDAFKFQGKQIDRLIDDVTDLKNEQTAKQQPHHDFKVGERVQFVNYERKTVVGNIRDICMDLATIEEPCEDGVGVHIMGQVPIEYLKPATDEPKCKFKVGDMVKNVGNKDNHYNKVGIVEKCMGFAKEVATNIYIIKFDDLDPIEHSLQYECDLESYTEPRWTFTDDEKVILRNLPKKYKWIGRDNCGLYIYTDKPSKIDEDCYYCDDEWVNLFLFKHLFQSIKWSDDQPCEFRKYL